MAVNYIGESSEIVKVAGALAKEKGISFDVVLESLKDAITAAMRKQYGSDNNVETLIDEANGGMKFYLNFDVVDNPNSVSEVSLAEARAKYKEDAKIGDVVRRELPPLSSQRVVAQVVRNVLSQGVKNAVKDKQYNDFKDRVNEIVYGVVKKASSKRILLDIDGAEAYLSKSESIPGEFFEANERIKVCIKKVVRSNESPQIYLSRADNQFLVKLFEQEVLEVFQKTVEIKAVVRDPGLKAKVAVISNDPLVDAVGACVGARGAIVQEIGRELQGEKIDVIEWLEDPVQLMINALAPAVISKVVVDEERHVVEVIVPTNQLRIAIGRKGQNVRLASKLVGWRIEVMDSESAEKATKERTTQIVHDFMEVLDIDEMNAMILVSEGLTDISQLVCIDPEDLANAIEGFSVEFAQSIYDKAEKYLETVETNDDELELEEGLDSNVSDLEGSKEDISQAEVLLREVHKSRIGLKEVEFIDSKLSEALIRRGVLYLDQLADLSRDDFLDVLPNYGLTHRQIDELILSSRKICFESEPEEK